MTQMMIHLHRRCWSLRSSQPSSFHHGVDVPNLSQLPSVAKWHSDYTCRQRCGNSRGVLRKDSQSFSIKRKILHFPLLAVSFGHAFILFSISTPHWLEFHKNYPPSGHLHTTNTEMTFHPKASTEVCIWLAAILATLPCTCPFRSYLNPEMSGHSTRFPLLDKIKEITNLIWWPSFRQWLSWLNKLMLMALPEGSV